MKDYKIIDKELQQIEEEIIEKIKQMQGLRELVKIK